MSKETGINQLFHRIFTFDIQTIPAGSLPIPNTGGLRVGGSEIIFKKNERKEMESIQAIGPDIIHTIYQQ